MSIEIYGEQDFPKLRAAGRVAAATLHAMGEKLKPGVSTADIDAWVRADTKARGATPSQLGYQGFPSAVCTSRNNVVCHGVPNRRDVLADGDILNVDVTSGFKGFHGDTSATFFIGTPGDEARFIVETARRARDAGISVIRDGARLGDIGAAIVEVARNAGCSVVRDFGGHGIGRKMHQPPHVSHVGERGTGIKLRAGMVLTVEPMINLGTDAIEILDDDWTVVTADGRLSAQFEHTVLVTKDGFEILTVLD